MIFELLYTSVPKGLKPGAKGYCTVLTTEGIPSALLERLEGYCGYRHLFSPGSPDNPEAFGHRILNLAGNTWHILSRVADAGSDYSGRSNLIGHFMAISQDELKGISAGPTSFMMSDGFFRTVLEGEPRRVSESETRKRLGNVTDKIQQALTWATVTGHAGWAGRLVQVTEETSDSIALVYPLRTKTLKLLDEAASILPKHKQWDITFNTFFTKSGEECRWRCYCADVTEASPFKGGEFDLMKVKKDGVPPVDSPYSEAAINGKKVGASPAAKSAPVAKVRTPIKPDSEKSLEAGQSFADKQKAKRDLNKLISGAVEESKQSSVKPTQHSLEVLPRQAAPLPPPVNRATRSIDLLNDVINDGKNSRNRKSQSRDPFKIAFIVTAVLLFIVVFIFAGIEIIRSKPNPAGVGITKDDSKKSGPISDKSPVVGIPKDDAVKSDPISGKSKEDLQARKSQDKKSDSKAATKEGPNEKNKTETAKTQPPENKTLGHDDPSKSAGDSVTTKKSEKSADPNTILITDKDLLVLGDQTRVVLLEKLLREKKDGFDKSKPLKLSIKTDTALIPTDFKLNEYFTTIEDELRLKAKRISNNELEITISDKIVNLDMKTDVEKLIDITMVYGVIKIGEINVPIQFYEPIELVMEETGFEESPILKNTNKTLVSIEEINANKAKYQTKEFNFKKPEELDGTRRFKHLKELFQTEESVIAKNMKLIHRFYHSEAEVKDMVIYVQQVEQKEFKRYVETFKNPPRNLEVLLPKAYIKIMDLVKKADVNENNLFKIEKYVDLALPLEFIENGKGGYFISPREFTKIPLEPNKKNRQSSSTNGDSVIYLTFLGKEWDNGLENDKLSRDFLVYANKTIPQKLEDGKMVDDNNKIIELAKKCFSPQKEAMNRIVNLLVNPPEIIVYLIPKDANQNNAKLLIAIYKPKNGK